LVMVAVVVATWLPMRMVWLLVARAYDAMAYL